MEVSRFAQFNTLVNCCAKNIQRLKTANMEQFHLSAAHVDCICRLAEHPEGMTQSEIAAAEGMDRSQVSRVLQILIQRELVRTDSDVGYKNHYFLTDEGTEIAGKLEAIILDINRFVSDIIPEEDISVFYQVFGAIARGLENTPNPQKP